MNIRYLFFFKTNFLIVSGITIATTNSIPPYSSLEVILEAPNISAKMKSVALIIVQTPIIKKNFFQFMIYKLNTISPF